MAKSPFEDSAAWKKSRILVKECYSLFGKQKDFGFRDQILRAAVSVMNNIAEGFTRSTQKELKQFLVVAQGSCGELRSMLYCALDIGYITSSQFDNAQNLSTEVSKILQRFIETVRTKI